MKKQTLNNLNLSSDFEKNKLLADRFYLSQALSGHSYESLKHSGWLNHDYSLEEMNKIQASFYHPFDYYCKGKEEVFILLNTGSYAPAHMGHIALLKKAKQKILSMNLTKNPIMVLSPSHDKYVLTKSFDILQWNIDKRMQALHQAIKDYPHKEDNDIFLVDPWESVYCEHPVNFTDVITKYIKDLESLEINYKIGYVFGSDNEQFLYAFSELTDKDKFYAICVEREDFPTHINSTASNVIYIRDKDAFYSLKSRQLRKNFQSISEKKTSNVLPEDCFYGVRHDYFIALKKWIEIYPDKAEQLRNSFNNFHIELKNTISQYINVPTKTISLDEQRSIVSSIDQYNCINLDIATNDINKSNMYALNFSRLFIASSTQDTPIKLIIRHENNSNARHIPPGKYVFMDDDIASGKTFSLISELLFHHGVSFFKQINLTQEFCNKNSINCLLFDIIDTKDFLLGSYTGGLICEIDNQAMRLPYFAKYVNLKTRASINYCDIVSFNNKVLVLNKNFFLQNKYLKVKDINQSLAHFLFPNKNKNIPIYTTFS